MWAKATGIIKNKHFLSLAGNGVMIVLGMVTTAIIFRAMPISEAGKWVFFQATYLLIDTFRSGFITTAFIKFYAGSDEARTAEVAGSTWVVGLIITGILVLLNLPAIFFSHYVTDEGLRLFIKWFGLAYLFTLPMFLATCVLQGEQRFDQLLYVRFVNRGLFIVFIIILLIIKKLTLDSLLYSYLISNLITSLYAMVMGWSRVNTLARSTKKTVMELYNFGKYSVGTTLSANMFRTSDTYIINFMLGPAPLAVYNLGQSLMQLVEVPLVSFAATGMPELSAHYNQNKREEVIYTMKKYAGMLTVILIPACIIAVLLADIAISLIGGGKYAHTEAANVFRLFMTFALLYPVDRFSALTLDVINKPKINFYKVLVMLAANILFDYLGILVLGNIYGVAVTTVVPVLIAVIISYIALNRYQKYNFWSVYTVGYKEAISFVKQGLGRGKA
ncbi:lipopolysaccharide biosynthesis protein [Mucilaginibacter sp. KACC 22063]|uniref:lipopolysaccharide biosynthesis protein n=1 Tax=Mucilaginibacter sp. KACC 22063 TaxID=3025666 RepID=UPI0023671FA5|nr:lipopolysaccharide biosynthesis protein [Mucilaginibacter sp. KACC 22063]WDF53681.1 lipopolysaccharide biosynthesis protein [Mucilaginibacter sp. KACC 22063]